MSESDRHEHDPQGIWGNNLDNVVSTGDARDLIVLSDRTDIAGVTNTGNDTVSSGGGNDFIFFGGGFDANDRVDGGTGFDTVGLLGNYNMTLDESSFTSIEKLAMYSSGSAANPFSYTINMADGNWRPDSRCWSSVSHSKPASTSISTGRPSSTAASGHGRP